MRADWRRRRRAERIAEHSAVGAAYLKVRADREAMRAEHKATREQIRSVLTPDQQQRLDTMKQERKERFGSRGERRGHREGFGR